jgi:outer membrane protein assembly factor BamB
VEIVDDDGSAIVGLDAATGEQLWRVAEADLGDAGASMGMPSRAVAPLANTEEVAVLSVPSGLVGLDRVSGKQLWSSDVSLLDESGVGVARGPAAVDGSTVMIPAASKVVTGVATDGGAIVSGPNLPPGETVAIPIGPSTLVAVDGTSGATLWQGPRLDHPAAAEGYVVGYVHSGPDSNVVVADVATGEEVWTKPGSESYGDLWALGDGAVYVNVRNETGLADVVAYELESGDERWRRSTDQMPGEPQQVIDDGVALLWNDLALLATIDGATRWTVPGPPETPMSSVGHNSTSMFVSFNGLAWTD